MRKGSLEMSGASMHVFLLDSVLAYSSCDSLGIFLGVVRSRRFRHLESITWQRLSVGTRCVCTPRHHWDIELS